MYIFFQYVFIQYILSALSHLLCSVSLLGDIISQFRDSVQNALISYVRKRIQPVPANADDVEMMRSQEQCAKLESAR